jgi:hypothetical protein
MRHWILTALMTLALTAPAFPHGGHGDKGCCKGKDGAKCEKCAKMAEGKGGGCCKKAKSGQDPAAKSEPAAPNQ